MCCFVTKNLFRPGMQFCCCPAHSKRLKRAITVFGTFSSEFLDNRFLLFRFPCSFNLSVCNVEDMIPQRPALVLSFLWSLQKTFVNKKLLEAVKKTARLRFDFISENCVLKLAEICQSLGT